MQPATSRFDMNQQNQHGGHLVPSLSSSSFVTQREDTRGRHVLGCFGGFNNSQRFLADTTPQYWPPRGGALCGLNHKYSTTPIWLIFVTWPVRTANNQRLTEKNPPRTWKQICWLICVGQQFCFVMFLFLGNSVYSNRAAVCRLFALCFWILPIQLSQIKRKDDRRTDTSRVVATVKKLCFR